MAGPPSLTSLAYLVGGVEGFRRFKLMLAELMPDSADEILRQPSVATQIEAFCKVFNRKYFPLGDMFETFAFEEAEDRKIVV